MPDVVPRLEHGRRQEGRRREALRRCSRGVKSTASARGDRHRGAACVIAPLLTTVECMNLRSRIALALLPLCVMASGPTRAADGPIDSTPEHSERTLILAGGALPVCSDLAPRACISAPEPRRDSRTAPLYRTDPEAFSEQHFVTSLAAVRDQLSQPLAQMLNHAAEQAGGLPVKADAPDEILFTYCADAGTGKACPHAQRSPWLRLTDAERAGLLSTLELPQIDAAGERRRERAYPAQSREAHGSAVLASVVEAASARSAGDAPRILIVTASALDPMEAVDFYRSAFTELGARAEWLPLDAAVARAIETGDCDLIGHRRAVLGLHRREQVYPDLHAEQQQACAQPDALSARIASAQALFFAGGDQWRLRQAFVRADGGALPWLDALRAAHARGDLVVGGTSAGAAVQSAAAMLTNGSPASALREPGRPAAPPEPGCARAGLCSDADEQRLSFWAEGGLGLAADAIVDTHFSERAREPRLLRLLAQTGARIGYGADEASALRIDSRGERRSVQAIGREGGWVFLRDADATDSVLEAQVFHLGPGARLRIDAGSAALSDPAGAPCLGAGADSAGAPGSADADPKRAARHPSDLVARDASSEAAAKAQSALDPGASRAAARALARCGIDAVELPGPAGQLVIERTPETRISAGSAGLGIGPLRMRWLPD